MSDLKCSFCLTESDQREYLTSEHNDACVCSNCAMMLTQYVLNQNSEDAESDDEDIEKISKVVFNLEFSNGDTYETEKKSFEFVLPDLFSEALSTVRDDKNQTELILFYKTLMAEDSPCYEQILTSFANFGYKKLGWGDVRVDFDSIEIDGHLVEWGDELFDFRDELQIQLAPSDEGHMMYLCN